MQNILDAILAGDTSAEDFAALDLPESYRAVTVPKDAGGVLVELVQPAQGAH